MPRPLTRRTLLTAATAALAAPALAQTRLERFVYGTNWIAQAEHGGFYQALADGTYRELGLEVEIRPGGPNVNNRALLAAGRIDGFMGGSLLQPFAAVEQGVPTVVVAAIFQKEPQAILTHPGQGLDTFESLKTIPLLISRTGEATFFRWMIAEHGFRPEQLRPYTFNSAPFCNDPRVGQQGYVTAEPFGIARACGFTPNAFLLADHGYDTLSTLIEVHRDALAARTDVVRRFVEGSIRGWARYLDGDARAADGMIRRDNPDMAQAQIDFSRAKLSEYGIVRPAGAASPGIGAIPEARVRSFYERMVRAGVVRAGIDWRSAYDDRFVRG